MFTNGRAKTSEGSVYRNKRVSIIRQFACFLISRGNDAYVAPKSPHAESEKPHVFKIEEVEAVFRCADHLPLGLPYMRLTVPVIFRFYYCLGLRLNEAIGLGRNDVDLSTGKVTIRMAKCLKDRVVYLPDDLRELAGLYDSRIAETVSDRALFFVSDVLGTKINDTGLCKIFNLAWTATGFAESADKKPTIHSFRHTFVVRKLEEWYSKKVDYTYWLPYLSTHLGHSTLEETYSYIHLVDSVFPQIRDSMGDSRDCTRRWTDEKDRWHAVQTIVRPHERVLLRLPSPAAWAKWQHHRFLPQLHEVAQGLHRGDYKAQLLQFPFRQRHKGFFLRFLVWIESRGCCKATRNQRFACIKTYARFVMDLDFEMASWGTDILSIPMTTAEKPTVGWLREEPSKAY